MVRNIKWIEIKWIDDPVSYGKSYFEVFPTVPWNYALVGVPEKSQAEAFKVAEQGPVARYSWNPENASIQS